MDNWIILLITLGIIILPVIIRLSWLSHKQSMITKLLIEQSHLQNNIHTLKRSSCKDKQVWLAVATFQKRLDKVNTKLKKLQS